LLSVGAGLFLLGHAARASAAIPDGRIELSGGKLPPVLATAGALERCPFMGNRTRSPSTGSQ